MSALSDDNAADRLEQASADLAKECVRSDRAGKPSKTARRQTPQKVAPDAPSVSQASGKADEMAGEMRTLPDVAATGSAGGSPAEGASTPTRSELAAYALGVRLSQAIYTSDPYAWDDRPTAELLAALERLRVAFDELVAGFDHFDAGTSERGRDVLENAWKVAKESQEKSRSAYEQCRQLIAVLQEICQRVLSQSPKHHLWFMLGLEIVRGSWEDPDGLQAMSEAGQSDCFVDVSGDALPPTSAGTQSATGAAERQKAYWLVDETERVDELMQQVEISWEQLFLEPREPCVGPRPFRELTSVDPGWTRIEAGLRQLTDAAVPEKPRVVLANDARDAWLYEQCCKRENGILPTFSVIANRLKEDAREKHWRIITDPTAIKNAANRWAKRNGKPPVPPRQRGRKPGGTGQR